VNDVPLKCGGKQYIKCLEGPVIPLYYKQGLCQMKTSKPTQTEIETLAVIDFTMDLPWDLRQEQDDEDIAPHDLRNINNFATRIMMLSDDVSAGQLCDLRTRPQHVASRMAIYGFSTITDDTTTLG